MLLTTLAKFIFSFLISNWIYSEAVLLCPSLDQVARTVYESSKIPTHDKWGRIARSPHARIFEGEINSLVDRLPQVKELAATLDLFDPNVPRFWKTGTLSKATKNSGLFTFGFNSSSNKVLTRSKFF